MNELFLKILNMSISASWLVLAVLLFRLVLKKAPKRINVVLWGIVALRLVFPFSIESALSLIPSAETIPLDIEMAKNPTIHTGIDAINSVVNPIISQSYTPNAGASMNPLQAIIPILVIFWISGIAVLLAYTVISYLRLQKKVSTAIPFRERIYQSENVNSPFVLGIIKPKIYLPFEMGEQDLNHVIAHEQAHIRRKDHWWKPLGFLLLSVHWFNPLMWLAYMLLCRDIELACDENVIKELSCEQRADYTQALLSCSVSRRMIAACPLAFGEVGVKERVKSVMNYKKPTFWIVIVAVIACIVLAVCFLTNPKSDNHILKYTITSYLNDEQHTEVNTPYNRENKALTVTVNFETTEGPTTIELIYGHKKNGVGNEWSYGDPLMLALGESITVTVPADTHFSFTAKALEGANGNVTFVFTEKEHKDGDENANHPKKTLSLNDVIILSQKGYELTWTDFEQYQYIETGFGVYIRVYEINELYQLKIGGAGPNSEPKYIYLSLADDADTRIDIRDGSVTEFVSEHNTKIDNPIEVIPMVMIDGTLYLDTGERSTMDARCGVMDGQITTSIEGEIPTEDNQSNFGTGYDYQYGAAEGTIEVNIDGEWWVFATKEVRGNMHIPVYNLSASEVEIPTSELGEYLFYTNSTEITVKVKGAGNSSGTIRLLDATQNDALCQTKEITPSTNEVTFANLISISNYRITWDGSDECIFIVSD